MELRDYPLREHPDVTIQRVKDEGEYGPMRLYRKRAFNKMMMHAKSKGVVNAQTYIDIQWKLWNKVHDNYPATDNFANAVPLPSLIGYLQNKETARVYLSRTDDEPAPFNELSYDELGDTVDHPDVIRWVFDHLDDPNIGAASAPSRGAWSFLQWARTSKKEFFNNHYKPMVAVMQKQQVESSTQEEIGERQACNDIREMIKVAVEAALA